ncbi:polysaccharide biosynthesis/export family protein [Methylobacterium sp. WSM2598]|uniref:polysaccharide biosynthesis/export family protein n=1 Tax=Methylobacterium sp. WSM2598 TaxID=398261 RepID=UPI00039D03B0|nr:polysaccharide biosynthesis/export family protein [Methylobacterium sp. WSM2598]
MPVSFFNLLPVQHKEPAASIQTAAHGRNRPALLILGTRGIPAAHGGFETFAERLALYMAARGWDVTVFCQQDVAPSSGLHGQIAHDIWRGVRRLIISVERTGPAGTIYFDWRSMIEARRLPGIPLVLGYNTACFLPMLRAQRRPVLVNMDGIEWKREKWSNLAKLWFIINERVACQLGSRLIADHPQIKDHLLARADANKITMIPYGADEIVNAPPELLSPYNLQPDKYLLLIARIEPENSILEIVRAFSRRPRRVPLVCIGNIDPSRSPYHQLICAEASPQVHFPGAVYDKPTVSALRRHALAYLHGHTVGGTNPSLVEALGAGSAIIAKRNIFNTWTAGPEQFYFSDEDQCDAQIERAFDDQTALKNARRAAKRRHRATFLWDDVLAKYEDLCLDTWQHVMRAALAVLALATSPFCPNARADYLLGPGDKLQITVSLTTAWRTTVNADGAIAMPQIGTVPLAGISVQAAQARLREEYRAKRIFQDADVQVEVTEYRPFYIDGDVAKPGSYPYQPRMTVRQAIASAGGLDMVRFRIGENPFVRAADLRSEYESIAIERARLLLRKNRINAELEGTQELRIDDLANPGIPPSQIRQLAALELAQLRHNKIAQEAEIAALTNVINESQENLNSLNAELSVESQATRDEEAAVASTRSYVTRGTSPETRLAEVRRDLASAKSRYHATQAQVWAAARALSEHRRQLARVVEVRRGARLAEAQETDIALQKLEAQTKALAEKFAVIGGIRAALYTSAGNDLEVTVYRQNAAGSERLTASSDSKIEPDDVVSVNVRPGRLLGMAATAEPSPVITSTATNRR